MGNKSKYRYLITLPRARAYEKNTSQTRYNPVKDSLKINTINKIRSTTCKYQKKVVSLHQICAQDPQKVIQSIN